MTRQTFVRLIALSTTATVEAYLPCDLVYPIYFTLLPRWAPLVILLSAVEPGGFESIIKLLLSVKSIIEIIVPLIIVWVETEI